MKKFVLFLTTFIIGLSFTIDVSAATITTVAKFIVINNKSSQGTYTLKDEDVDKLKEMIPFSSSVVEEDRGSTYQNNQGNSEIISWLLEHNIISSDTLFTTSFDNLTTVGSDNSALGSSGSSARKSDLVMALYKAFYGEIKSRPIIVHTKCKQSTVISGDNITDYSEGAYFTYVTPNVYEKYFTAMLDKGFININEFKDLDFIHQYKNLSNNKPDWFGDGLYEVSTNSEKESPLGKCFTLSSSSGIDSSLTFSRPNYFMDETISSLDALKLIERILRVNEKDMTDTEAKVINYKYGVKYLNKLDDDTKSTVRYLVAMGILNFEDENEFNQIYSTLSIDFFQTLVYRCANKAARKDFSKVQLTDSENYWLQQGLSEYDVDIMSKGVSDIEYKITDPSSNEQTDNSFFKRRKVIYNDGQKEFNVELTFTNPSQYTYDGKNVTELEEGEPKEVTKIEDGGKVVTFKIKAPSQCTALAIVQTKISIVGSEYSNQKIDTIAKVSADGMTTYNFISKSALQNVKDGDGNKIIPLEDKYLYNASTQTYAVLLDDNKRAIIGNEIVDTSDTIVRGIEGEVYYNLDIIVGLMTNSYLDSLWGNRVIDAYSDYNTSCKYQGVQDIRNYKSESNAEYTVIDKGVMAKFDTRDTDYLAGDNQDVTEKTFISMQHSQKALNVLYKNIQPQTEFSNPVYMVVEWKYTFPQWVWDSNNSWHHESSINGTDMKSLIDCANNPSTKEMNDYLNTEPKDEVLKKWWNSNLGLSNALCNYLFNTTGVKYCSNGWMTPSVTILSEADYSEDDLNSIMDSLPFPGSYDSEFIGDHTITSLFGAGSGTYGSLASSRVFRFYKGSSANHDFYSDFSKYVLTKTHTLYASIDDGGIEPCMRVKSNPRGGWYVEMVTRNKVNTGALQVGNTYTLDGDEYICQETYSDNSNSKMYMVLVRKKPITVTADSSGSDTYSLTLTDDSIDVGSLENNHYTAWWRSIAEKLGADNVLSLPQYTTAFGVQGYANLEDDSLVFTTGCRLKNVNKPSDYDSSIDNVGSTSEVLVKIKDKGAYEISDSSSEEGVKVYPAFYVSRFGVSVNPDSGEIKSEEMDPCSCRENLTRVGISSAIIDSIANKYYGAVSQSEIPDDATVSIGDLTFIAKYGKLYSTPIGDTSLINQAMMSGTSNDVLESIFAKCLGNNLEIVESFGTVDDDDGSDEHSSTKGVIRSETLASYVNKNSSGEYQWDLCKCPIKIDDTKHVLTRDGGSTFIACGSKTDRYKQGDYFDSFCFSVQFNSCIKFKPLNQEGTAYSLVYCTDKGSNGYLDDIPWFTGSLSYNWDSSLFGKMGTNSYNPAEDSDTLMDEILAAYKSDFQKTILAYICKTIIYLITLMIILNLFAPLLKKISILNYICEKIKYPNGPDSHGIDIIAILSLGTVSFESDESAAKSFGVAGILVVVLVLFIHATAGIF